MTETATPEKLERRHRWNEPVSIHPSESSDGNERTERTCAICGAVKITVHVLRRYATREWRAKDGSTWTGSEPPCLELVSAMEKPL